MYLARSLAPLLAILLATTAARAQDPGAKKRAGEHFRTAEQALAKGAFVTAAEEFELADSIAPHPATKMNAAEAWERAGELARAAEIAERVQATADGAPRASATALLVRVAPRVPVRAMQQQPPEPEPAPPPPPAAPAAPPPAPVVIAAPPASPPSSRGVPVLAWTSFGLAAAGVATFGVFGARTLDAQSKYDADPTPATRDAFHTNKTTANVALAAAGVFAALGVVLVVTAPREKRIAILPTGIVGEL